MKIICSFLLMLAAFATSAQKLSVYDMQCDHRVNPVGIDNPSPRFSWKLSAPGRDVMQSAYSLRVATSPAFGRGAVVWESGQVASDQSVLVPYKGPSLESGKRYFWQVKVVDNQRRQSSWSAPAFFETGFFDPANWKASWVYPQHDTSVLLIPALMLRKEFALSKPVASARLYITSLGMYEASLNGRRAGDEFLTPGWTSYKDRLQYQVFDVTASLKQGPNAIGVMLANGWYRSNLGWTDNWGIWGKQLGLLAQLNIVYADGTSQVIGTDGSWKSSADGPVVMTGIYEGETYDARKVVKGWDQSGFNDNDWTPVRTGPAKVKRVVATGTVPVRRVQEVRPVRIFTTPKGTLVADFGQNLVGWVRLSGSAPGGTVVTIRHAEVLDKHGEFYTENLRKAKATMQYIFSGSGTESYEPKFTFFGFRYIAVEGFSGQLRPENVTAVVVHSDMSPAGTFECSHPLVNQLQKNIVWGQKGNFVDVPTDCPQRDERLGWTGDAQVFAKTAAFNMNVAAFFSKWLKDLAADQLKDGTVPPVIPNIMKGNIAGSAGWADAATIIPWNLYEVYGDTRFLEEQYASMTAWLAFIESKSKNDLWNTGFHFGDWLFYRPSDDVDGRSAVTDKYMIAQCFWAYSTQLVINAARVLGKQDDADKYARRLKAIKDAYRREYLTPSGRLVSGTQTAYVLALQFDMLPEELRAQAAERLAANIRDYNNHLTTGFLGTPYLCHVLSRYGYDELAYSLLLQETYPSWLYPVKMGATTIWERWDGQKPDSTFQNPGMNSFNHYAYGAIGEWMYQISAGLQPETPGYKTFRIEPHPDKRLSYARAAYESPYGQIRSGWERRDGEMVLTVRIPPNTRAVVTIPVASAEGVTIDGRPIAPARTRVSGARLSTEVGSGEYTFRYPVQ